MTVPLILGTAGHIDHGKTTLIKALTGTNTDRLPEEKKRGITIELGFAQLELGDFLLGIVDVPGHEKFVRQMLAGATSMDLAMLVVAADDSVKQQTREHLDILRLLDLPAGVIALTKCDLAEPDWIDLVEEEIRELVEGSFLAKAPILRTSAATGEGLDELRSALTTACRAAAEARTRTIEAPFRMAVDRAFTIEGHGTVVTGSVASGRAQVGDVLMLQPGDREVRLRGIQSHDESAEEVYRGQRAAINLASVDLAEVARGHELASPAHLVGSRLLSVKLSVLPEVARPLKDRARVRLHVGTAESMASVRLIDAEILRPGESALAQLFLSQPVVVTWNQPLVIRSESPIETIGGGRVLDPHADRIRRASDVTVRLLNDLSATEETRRAGAALFFAGLRGWSAEDLSRTAGISNPQAVEEALRESGDLQRLSLARGRQLLVHRETMEQAFEQIAKTLSRFYDQYPLRSSHPRTTIVQSLEWMGEAGVVDAILEKMQAVGRIKLTDDRVALVGRGPKLSKGEAALLDEIVDQYKAAEFQPPTVKEVQQQAKKNRESVPQLVALAAAEGQLVEFAQDFYLHADHDRTMREKLSEALAQSEGLTVSEIREVLQTTRKFAVPLCEYLDRSGFTRRSGDVRVRAGNH